MTSASVDPYRQAAAILRGFRQNVAFTAAGISVKAAFVSSAVRTHCGSVTTPSLSTSTSFAVAPQEHEESTMCTSQAAGSPLVFQSDERWQHRRSNGRQP